ncbi:MAG: hypothetical protein JO265_08745 [Acidimicrobiia bacterium]|nr:hypothetical protein [Acidimicrobiia bacterium]
MSRAPPGSFSTGARLDAVLADYQDLHSGSPTLAWVFVDRNVEVMPSMGSPECGTVTVIVNAKNGAALGEYQGAAVV